MKRRCLPWLKIPGVCDVLNQMFALVKYAYVGGKFLGYVMYYIIFLSSW